MALAAIMVPIVGLAVSPEDNMVGVSEALEDPMAADTAVRSSNNNLVSSPSRGRQRGHNGRHNFISFQ